MMGDKEARAAYEKMVQNMMNASTTLASITPVAH